MKRLAKILAALLISASSGSLFGQSVLHCHVDGMWMPVEEMKGAQPYCFTGDSLVKGSREDMTLLPTADFGEGFIDIEIKANMRQGVVQKDGILRFTSDKSWYLMKARVVSDTDLENCYYAMRFDTYGTYSYYCRPIGDLKAGKPKTIEIFMRLGYEMPQQLHVFSGMEEIRTTLVPTAYSYNFGHFTIASR